MRSRHKGSRPAGTVALWLNFTWVLPSDDQALAMARSNARRTNTAAIWVL